jgi:serine/threonine-protein kinase PRP4
MSDNKKRSRKSYSDSNYGRPSSGNRRDNNDYYSHKQQRYEDDTRSNARYEQQQQQQQSKKPRYDNYGAQMKQEERNMKSPSMIESKNKQLSSSQGIKSSDTNHLLSTQSQSITTNIQETLKDNVEDYESKVQKQIEQLQKNSEDEVKRNRELRRERLNALKLKAQQQQQQQQQQQNTTVNNEPEEEVVVVELEGTKTEVKNERSEFMHELEKERDKIHEELPTVDSKSNNNESPIFDMFSDSPLNTSMNDLKTIKGVDQNVSGNFDDEDGYYRFTASEIVNNQYQIVDSSGKGVFSTVVKAINLTTNETVAIKILRNQESMRKSGMKEIEILKKLNDNDPQDVCYVVQMKDNFIYRNHLCIVFEPLYMNLREIIKKFGKEQGREVGISLEAVRVYSKQLFVALQLLQKSGILHADIKPDNILVNHRKSIAKLCDYGSASDISENSITPYLVSRFYRAPEIILGMPYGHPIDMWSVGCTLYELYTGRILFQSRDNNDQLRHIMQYKGKIPNKMLKKCVFRDAHFDHHGNFLFQDIDPITKKPSVRTIEISKTKDLRTDLLNATENLNQDEQTRKRVLQLYDVIDRSLTLDPSKRLTVQQALSHPFYQQ